MTKSGSDGEPGIYGISSGGPEVGNWNVGVFVTFHRYQPTPTLVKLPSLLVDTLILRFLYNPCMAMRVAAYRGQQSNLQKHNSFVEASIEDRM